MSIYAKKDSEYVNDSLEYTKLLIKANNNQLTDTEINELISNAKQKASAGSKKVAYNGSGITVGYIEDEESIEYQIKRFYK